MRFNFRTTLAMLATSALAPASAWAGGFTATRFGGEHAHAATDDPTAVYYNPAGLAYGHGTRGLIEGLFAYRTADFTRDPGAVDDAANQSAADLAANTGKSTLANVIVSPFIGVASDLGIEGLGVGVGLYAPFGGQSSWDENSEYDGNATYPGALDGPARWSSIEGEQRSVYVTAAGAWRVPSGKFAIGAGLNVVSSSLSLVRARNLDGTDRLLNEDGSIAEGRSLLELSDLTVAASIGVMFKPTDCMRLGLSYQSQPGFGEMTLGGTLTNKFGTAAAFEVPVEMRQALPDSLRLGGVWQAAAKVKVHFNAEVQRWSLFENQCLVQTGLEGGAKCAFLPSGALDTGAGGANVLVNIPRDWKNTYSLRVGGSYDVSDALELNAGVMFDSNAVPDDTLEPALVDANKVIGQLGGRYDISDKLQLSGTLGYVGYAGRSTTPRAVDPATPSRNPDMAGDYGLMVAYALFGVGVQL